jgi:hypothetical protein
MVEKDPSYAVRREWAVSGRRGITVHRGKLGFRNRPLNEAAREGVVPLRLVASRLLIHLLPIPRMLPVLKSRAKASVAGRKQRELATSVLARS